MTCASAAIKRPMLRSYVSRGSTTIKTKRKCFLPTSHASCLSGRQLGIALLAIQTPAKQDGKHLEAQLPGRAQKSFADIFMCCSRAEQKSRLYKVMNVGRGVRNTNRKRTMVSHSLDQKRIVLKTFHGNFYDAYLKVVHNKSDIDRRYDLSRVVWIQNSLPAAGFLFFSSTLFQCSRKTLGLLYMFRSKDQTRSGHFRDERVCTHNKKM
jgi:hypothetical protein